MSARTLGNATVASKPLAYKLARASFHRLSYFGHRKIERGRPGSERSERFDDPPADPAAGPVIAAIRPVKPSSRIRVASCNGEPIYPPSSLRAFSVAEQRFCLI
jgi:hypothetical protein